MKKNVLIISSSPRKNGNSETLAKQFEQGAKSAGHNVEMICLRDKDFGYCTGCYACTEIGHCVIKDDAAELIDKVHDADVLVFATPVYFFSVSAQLKTLFDRTMPLYGGDYKFTKVYALSAAEMNDATTFEGMEKAVCGWTECYDRAEFCGGVYAGNVTAIGEITGHPALGQAYEMGRWV